MDKSKVIDRVRKLRALAKGNDNPHEARAALLLATKLMEQYGLTEPEVAESLRAPGAPSTSTMEEDWEDEEDWEEDWEEDEAQLTPPQRFVWRVCSDLLKSHLRRGLTTDDVVRSLGRQALKSIEAPGNQQAILDLLKKMGRWL